MSKDGLMHSIPKPPEVVDFLRCNNADIEWYVRMPADALLEDPKVTTLLGQYKEDNTTPEAIVPCDRHITFHIEKGGVVCWNKIKTVLVGQTQYPTGQSGKQKRYHTTLNM